MVKWKDHRSELAVVALWGLCMILGTAFVQTMPFDRGLAWDSGEYARIQEFGPMGSGAKAPFAFRILVPSLARLISGTDSLAGFRVLNAISLLLIPLLLLKWARAYGLTRDGPILLAIAFFQFHGMVAWYFFCPVMVDLPAIAILLGALYSAKIGRNVVFGMLLVLGALCKEFVMWGLVYHFVLNRTEFRRPRTWLLFLAAYTPSITVFLGVRNFIPVPIQPGEYYLRTIKVYWEISTSVLGLYRVLVGFIVTLGPFAMLAALDSNAVKSFCVKHWEVPIFALIGVPFVFVGGTNISLFWFYLFPVFLLLGALGCHALKRPVDWLNVLPALVLAGIESRRFILGWPTNLKDYLYTGVFWMLPSELFMRVVIFFACLVTMKMLAGMLSTGRIGKSSYGSLRGGDQ